MKPFGLIVSELWPSLGFQPPWHSSLRFQRNVVFSFLIDSFRHFPSGLDLSFVNFGLFLWDFLITKIVEATEAKIWAKEAKMKKIRQWFDEKCLKKSFDDSIFDFYFQMRLLCHWGWKSVNLRLTIQTAKSISRLHIHLSKINCSECIKKCPSNVDIMLL